MESVDQAETMLDQFFGMHGMAHTYKDRFFHMAVLCWSLIAGLQPAK
jgi:hypothetical protein